jgi:hypothetical protein
MIKRLITIKNPLFISMVTLRRASNGVIAIELDLIADCVSILKPFECMTS